MSKKVSRGEKIFPDVRIGNKWECKKKRMFYKNRKGACAETGSKPVMQQGSFFLPIE